jgi:hypothetical protein
MRWPLYRCPTGTWPCPRCVLFQARAGPVRLPSWRPGAGFGTGRQNRCAAARCSPANTRRRPAPWRARRLHGVDQQQAPPRPAQLGDLLHRCAEPVVAVDQADAHHPGPVRHDRGHVVGVEPVPPAVLHEPDPNPWRSRARNGYTPLGNSCSYTTTSSPGFQSSPSDTSAMPSPVLRSGLSIAFWQVLYHSAVLKQPLRWGNDQP